MHRPRRIRHLARALCVAALLAFPGAAMAADCPDKVAGDVVADAYDDGMIQGTYSKDCYREALTAIPEDLKVYSAAADVIRAKMNAPTPAKQPTLPDPGPTEPEQEPTRTLSGGPGDEADPSTTPVVVTLPDAPVAGDGGGDGPVQKAIGFGKSDDPGDVPIPVIVLGGLAVLLLLGGGASVLVRRRLEGRDSLF